MYSNFTVEQRDIKQTLDNFSRDYAERISRERELVEEICELRQKNKSML